MSEPAHELPADSPPDGLPRAVEEARRGVITYLTVAGERVAAIVPEAAIEALRAAETALPNIFPWVRFLPHEDVKAFLVELVKTARDSAELDNMAQLEAVIAAWRGTAEIHADPELLEAATARLDGTDYGSVPVPS